MTLWLRVAPSCHELQGRRRRKRGKSALYSRRSTIDRQRQEQRQGQSISDEREFAQVHNEDVAWFDDTSAQLVRYLLPWRTLMRDRERQTSTERERETQRERERETDTNRELVAISPATVRSGMCVCVCVSVCLCMCALWYHIIIGMIEVRGICQDIWNRYQSCSYSLLSPLLSLCTSDSQTIQVGTQSFPKIQHPVTTQTYSIHAITRT